MGDRRLSDARDHFPDAQRLDWVTWHGRRRLDGRLPTPSCPTIVSGLFRSSNIRGLLVVARVAELLDSTKQSRRVAERSRMAHCEPQEAGEKGDGHGAMILRPFNTAGRPL